jgi:copper chaperone CopZ
VLKSGRLNASNLAVLAPLQQKDPRSVIQFRVPDIHCDGCVRSLTGAVRGVDAKAEFQADMETKMVRIETTVGEESIAEAMRDAGFTVEVVIPSLPSD